MSKANETLAQYFQGKPDELAELLDRKDERIRELERENSEQSDLIERLRGERREWVKVEERLPKHYQHVLITITSPEAGTAFMPVQEGYISSDGRWRVRNKLMHKSLRVVAWRELPEPFTEAE